MIPSKYIDGRVCGLAWYDLACPSKVVAIPSLDELRELGKIAEIAQETIVSEEEAKHK